MHFSSNNANEYLCNLFNIKGKVALLTGGGTGIGKMIAEGLAANGVKVFITSRKIQNLKKTAEEINSKYPNSVEYIVSNLDNRHCIEEFVDELKQRTSKLDILINNSAMTWADPIDKFNEERGWDKLYAVNVKAPFYLSAFSIMYDARAGAFFRPKCGIWSYCTSKAALNHLTMVLSNEYTSKQITVNTLMPGLFKSRMTTQGMKHWPEKMKAICPNGRYGDICDITGCVIFLCSKAGSHISGTTIVIDGGSHVGKAIEA